MNNDYIMPGMWDYLYMITAICKEDSSLKYLKVKSAQDLMDSIESVKLKHM